MRGVQKINGKLFDLRAYEDDIKEYIKEIDKSHYKPSDRALRGLFDLYEQYYPNRKLCFSCRGERAQVYKWFKQQLKTWTSQ